MATVAQNIALIRQRLNEPGPQTPSNARLLNILIEHLSNHYAQLNNTQQHWSVDRLTLTTSAGQEDYAVGGPTFGRPFLVYTTDLTNPYHVRWEVPFSLMQNADQMYWGPQQTVSVYPHSAEEVIFYRRDNQWYVRVMPIPNQTGTYDVWFEVNYEFGALGDAPGLAAFHHLIRTQVALSALPYCAWGVAALEHDAERWKLMIDMLRESLLKDEAMYQKEFNQYKAQATREGVGSRIGFGEWDEWGQGGYPGRMIDRWGI